MTAPVRRPATAPPPLDDVDFDRLRAAAILVETVTRGEELVMPRRLVKKRKEFAAWVQILALEALHQAIDDVDEIHKRHADYCDGKAVAS